MRLESTFLEPSLRGPGLQENHEGAGDHWTAGQKPWTLHAGKKQGPRRGAKAAEDKEASEQTSPEARGTPVLFSGQPGPLHATHSGRGAGQS